MNNKLITIGLLLILSLLANAQNEALIIDHNHARLSVLKSIPLSAINQAKQKLHIRYWHVSHGNQIIVGMRGLDPFMGNPGIYTFGNNVAGKLDVDDIMGTDLSDLNWQQKTRNFLDSAEHADCNVIMWGWCSSLNYSAAEYCNKMEELIAEYGPEGTKIKSGARTVPVQFVFFNSYLNPFFEAETETFNSYIRQHCINNKRIFFDFGDMDSWNPDNVSFAHKKLSDDASYEISPGVRGNWADEWTAGKVKMSHVGDVAHNEPNGGQWYYGEEWHQRAMVNNLKAYAAWYLFARIAGWDGTTSSKKIPANKAKPKIFPNPADETLQIENTHLNSATFVLTALNGTQIKEVLIPAGTTNLNISEIPKGMYLCSIKTKDSNFTQKLIIQ